MHNRSSEHIKISSTTATLISMSVHDTHCQRAQNGRNTELYIQCTFKSTHGLRWSRYRDPIVLDNLVHTLPRPPIATRRNVLLSALCTVSPQNCHINMLMKPVRILELITSKEMVLRRLRSQVGFEILVNFGFGNKEISFLCRMALLQLLRCSLELGGAPC